MRWTRWAAAGVMVAALLALQTGSGVWAGVSESQLRQARNTAFTADENGNVRLTVLYRDLPAAGKEALPGRGRLRRQFHLIPAVSLEVPAAELDAALAELELDPRVVVVEADSPDQRIDAQVVPWGVSRVNAPAVRRDGNAGGGVKVGVMDTGIDYTHPDLAARYRGGYDAVNDDLDPRDDHGHGTHVAGTIAAVNNSLGVVGVAPRVDLYAVKTIAADGSGYTSDFVQGLEWCVDHGMKVVNYSAGSRTGSAAMQAAVEAAWSAGVTFVAAAGNDGRSGISYPAAYGTRVLAVGAVNKAESRWAFSNYGSQLDVVAPGVGVLSTTVGGGYHAWDGTSMAAPHVSGVAALVIASGVEGPAAVAARITGTARDLGAAGKDSFYGWGLVDAQQAVLRRNFLTFPTGGELFGAGSVVPVSWDAFPGAATYRLEYTLDGATWVTAADGLTTTGVDWTVPVPSGNRVKAMVRIWAMDGSTPLAYDRSDRFTVAVVHVTSLLDGGSFVSQQTVPLAWDVYETCGDVTGIDVSRTIDGGATWKSLITLGPEARTWDWVLGTVRRERDACRLKVTLLGACGGSPGADGSDGFFTIAPAP